METLYYDLMDSPVGIILIGVTGKEHSLFLLHYPLKGKPETVLEVYRKKPYSYSLLHSKTATAAVKKQLRLYFAGKLHNFDLTLNLHGTPFQKSVWEELLKIPYGTTISYGELARRIGSPGAARAVGMANNKNRLGIIVPCHRVIGANGDLTGYAGGLKVKRLLLELENSGRI